MSNIELACTTISGLSEHASDRLVPHEKDSPATLSTLRACFRAYRGWILLTYGLYNAENLALLVRPWVLGLAINDLLQGHVRGLLLLVVQHVVHTLLAAGRQVYDTRAFTRIYRDVASQLVTQQRRANVDVSRVAARSSLSREIVDFFERLVPYVFTSVYSVLGALVMLVLCDGWLVPLCLVLLLPVFVMSLIYARKSYTLNGRLNDQLEREVDVIGRGEPAVVRRHYTVAAAWRVKLSDLQALNFALMSVFLLALLAAALLRCCLMQSVDAGRIFAVLGYVVMFATGLSDVPILVQQLSRVRDIKERMTN